MKNRLLLAKPLALYYFITIPTNSESYNKHITLDQKQTSVLNLRGVNVVIAYRKIKAKHMYCIHIRVSHGKVYIST